MRSRMFPTLLSCILLLAVVSLLFVSCSDDDNPAGPTTPAVVDNHEILFLSDRGGAAQIYVMDADGTNLARLVSDAAIYDSPTWSPDGQKIVCARQTGGVWGICVLSANGSSATMLAESDSDDRYPVWSTDGSRIAFESWRDGDREIYVVDSDGTNLVRVTNHPGEDKMPAWHPDDTLLTYVSKDTSAGATWKHHWVLPEGTGLATEPALLGTLGGYAAWSATGTKFFHCMLDNRNLSIVDAITLDPIGLIGGSGLSSPSWSPIGEGILMSVLGGVSPGKWVVYYVDWAGNSPNVQVLTSNTSNSTEAVWEPDMTHVVFCSDRDGNSEIYIMNADGSEQTRLTTDLANDWSPHWRTLP